MKRVLLSTLLVSACNVFETAPPPTPQIRVDTVTVTVTAEPQLPEATATEVCLSTGVTAQIHLAANGDTLVGEKRIRLADLKPAVTFAGVYAADREWYRRGDVVNFERRNYRRSGVERIRVCDELKLVGEHMGVPVFAEVTAPQVLPMVIIPVRPGIYQDYMRVR